MVWHILVVEADEALSHSLTSHLEERGYQVAVLSSGQSALDLIEREGLPHLAVIAASLPDMDGLDLARNFAGQGAPVIVTGGDSWELAVRALQWADDYVRQPYAPAELAARVRRVLSRVPDYRYARAPLVEIDQRLQADFTNNRLIVDDQPVALTPTEVRLLQTLVENRGRVVESGTLLARAWPAGDADQNTLRVHVHRLRQKIEADPRNPAYLLTVRGMGYAFGAGETRR